MKKLSGILALMVVFASCKKTEPIEIVQETGALLVYSSDFLIIPAYAELEARTGELEAAVIDFNTQTDQPNLNELRSALNQTRLAWQDCSPFGFGPAEVQELEAWFNTFPSDTVAIESNLDNGNAAFTGFARWGLPAMAYLLYHGEDAAVLDAFSNNIRKELLLNITQSLKERATAVRSSWTASYRNSFITKTGTQAGSGLSLLVNYSTRDYENFRRFSIALPLGLLTLGIPLEDKVEGLHGDQSVVLAQARLDAHYRIFRGISHDELTDGSGYEELLNESNAQFGNGTLSEAIIEDYEAARLLLSSLPEPLDQTILNQPELVQAAYDQLQQLLVHLKTDMTSALGVSITYSDNDGD